VSLPHAILGVLSGFVSGTMGGAFGVGGAILTTPAVQVLLGAPPLVAVGTPLPAIIPTTLSGLQAYRRAEQIDYRAVRWAAPAGALGATGGAMLTKFVNPHILLLATAVLIGWQAFRVATGRGRADRTGRVRSEPTGRALALAGSVAGFTSGLLGIGGGVVLVPLMAGTLGMPLKRTIGTSLVVISVMVIPGTVVHALLGHIDWTIFLLLSIGAIPGAALGSRWTIRARERTLRLVVGIFLGAVAVLYGVLEVHRLAASL
jgi:uncharacterized membrane protein YfcA